jgi:sugar lactone lactonase YvrE
MPVLRPSGSDFTSFVKAAAQYVPAGRNAKPSKSGGVPVALPGLGAVVRTSQVGALASPTTSAVVINGVTPLAAVAAVAVVIRVLLGIVTTLGSASFNNPSGVAVLSDGNIVVADQYSHRIRLVTPLGVVTTLAGSGSAAFADGTGTAASFNYPAAVAMTSTGDIVVSDTNNHRIRLVTQGGVVTTLAGSGTAQFADGTGPAASFYFPYGVAMTSTGVIVVADTGNNRIRLVNPTSGVVTTLAGSGSGTFADGTGASASFNGPNGVAVIPSSGVIVVADTGNHRIRLVTPAGVVTTLAGSGSPAFADGTGALASFSNLTGVAVTSTGDIIVADKDNHRIRLVTYPGGVVTTLAGNTATFADGTGAAARFNQPRGVAVTPTGDVVVADTFNNRIRLIV